MSDPRFKPIWNIISTYGINLPEDFLNDDLRCVICKKIMRDACTSISCGCQYCYDCIHEYNNMDEKYCPGDKQDCKDQHILFGTNVYRSEVLNKRISRIKVQCPNESCRNDIELIQMEEHLRVCKKQCMDCPFVAIVCISEPINRETLESHLHSDNVTHTQLLIELIQNLKNEVNEMKEEFAKSKLDSMDKDNRIAALEEQLNREIEMRVNIEIQRTEEIGELRRQLEERDAMVTELRKDVDDNFGQSKLEMTSLKEGSRNKEERMASMEEELSVLRKEGEMRMNEILVTVEREISKQMRQREDSRIKKETPAIMMTDLRKNVDGVMEWRKKNDEQRDRRMDKCDKLCRNIVKDFRWKMDQLSTKICIDLYSEPFYSNNYKFCLRLWIYDDNIYLHCHIMKGDNDDMVKWPMKRVVTLKIVNQVILKAHKTRTYKYDTFDGNEEAFNRPTKERNYHGIGSYMPSPFIEYSSIKSKQSIVVKDSIVVSCAVSDH